MVSFDWWLLFLFNWLWFHVQVAISACLLVWHCSGVRQLWINSTSDLMPAVNVRWICIILYVGAFSLTVIIAMTLKSILMDFNLILNLIKTTQLYATKGLYKMVYFTLGASVGHQEIKNCLKPCMRKPSSSRKNQYALCKILNNILNIQNHCAPFLRKVKYIYNLKDSVLNFRIYNFLLLKYVFNYTRRLNFGKISS